MGIFNGKYEGQGNPGEANDKKQRQDLESRRVNSSEARVQGLLGGKRAEEFRRLDSRVRSWKA